MEKKRQFAATIRHQIAESLQTNPVEAILGLCFFVIFIMENIRPEGSSWRYIPFMFPTLFTLTYSFHHLFTGKLRPVYYLSLLALLPLILLSEHLDGFINSPAYGFTMLLTFFLLLGYKKTGSNTSFAMHCVRLIVNAAFAFVTGMLLMGMISAIYLSVTYIFGLSSYENVLKYALYFILYIFIPLFFCQSQQEEESGLNILPKAIQFILNFILSPGVIIYTAILYIYFITIAVNWELPKGGVAYMVFAFIIASFAGRMSQLIVSQKYYEWFYRPFGFIAVPPLILFWIGAMHRISAYNLTELRVYLLAAGILMTLYVFFLYSKRLGSYRLMLLASSLVIVLLTYIPGISARSIGIISQAHRMERLAEGLSLRDAATGKLSGTEKFLAKDSAQLSDARQLNDSYTYLQKELGKNIAITRYGDNALKLAPETAETIYYYRPEQNIPLDGYKNYLPGCKMHITGNDILDVRQKGNPLLEINLKEHFARYKESISKWGEEATEVSPFCFSNDSCMVIIDTIVKDENGDFRPEQTGTLLVFGR